jgi:hypothetical protein
MSTIHPQPCNDELSKVKDSQGRSTRVLTQPLHNTIDELQNTLTALAQIEATFTILHDEDQVA